MNERYLFRAKRKDNGEMVEGCLLILDDGEYRIATSCLQGDVNEILAVCAYEVDQSTICQCTGLKDKNGKLVWENDIVYPFSTLKGIVRFGVRDYSKEFGFYIEWKSKSCYRKDFVYWNDKCEVIGNIFDNPGLL